MSMHLCGPALTTTSYKKRKVTVTKSQQEEFERGWRARNQRLKEMKLPKETLEQYMEWVYGKGKKEKGQKISGKKVTKASSYLVTSKKGAADRDGANNKDTTVSGKGVSQSLHCGGTRPDHDGKSKEPIPGHGKLWVTGACSSKPAPTYTGTEMIAISQMHKSNAVPVFRKEEIIEIARMRR